MVFLANESVARPSAAFFLASVLAAVIIVPESAVDRASSDAGELAAVACGRDSAPDGFRAVPLPRLPRAGFGWASHAGVAPTTECRHGDSRGGAGRGARGPAPVCGPLPRGRGGRGNGSRPPARPSSRSVWWFSHITEIYTLEAAVALLGAPRGRHRQRFWPEPSDRRGVARRHRRLAASSDRGRAARRPPPPRVAADPAGG